MDPSILTSNGVTTKEVNPCDISNGTASKLPLRRCYDQALFEAEMNDSDIMFGTRDQDSEGLFSAMAMASKKETMETASVAAAAVESLPVENPSG
jgi:hypothetical protein